MEILKDSSSEKLGFPLLYSVLQVLKVPLSGLAAPTLIVYCVDYTISSFEKV